MNEIKSQGTELFLKDTRATAATVVKFTCPTGITGLGGKASQIATTCLDETVDETYVRGLGQPGEVSVPFNLRTDSDIHQDLFALKASGETFDWVVGLSDATGDPTLDSAEAFVLATTRSWLAFSAYIADVNIDIAGNDIVKGTLTLQRSGAVTATWKA